MRFIVNIEKFEENDKEKEPNIKVIEKSDIKEIAWKLNYPYYWDKIAESKYLSKNDFETLNAYAKSVRADLFKKYPTTFKKAVEAMLDDDVSKDDLNKILDDFTNAEKKILREAIDKWYDLILEKKEIREILIKIYAKEEGFREKKDEIKREVKGLLNNPSFYKYLDKNMENNPILQKFYESFKDEIDEGREKFK